MTETMLASIGDLRLRLGSTLPDVKLAYVTYGKLAPDRRNAILLTHGYTSSHLFAQGAGASEGSWSSLVGSGRAIDTDTYFVVSSNMLGSSAGSTAPRSKNPATGYPYGPDFPDITLADIVTAQRQLLERLGVRQLAAVIGPSYGGFQAFAWGTEYPDFVRGLVPVVTAPAGRAAIDVDGLRRLLATDPNWNDGHYYDKGGIVPALIKLREETLRRYGIEAELAPRFPDPAARDVEIHEIARRWAAAFDGHSLIVLGRAMTHFDATPKLGRIKARVLYVLSRTDKLFPPSLAPDVMKALSLAGVDARYFEIDSPHGHLASGTDAAKWEPALRTFSSPNSASPSDAALGRD
jgi:homoserine O-acetyltransferase/O-succinyltransferase